MKFIFECEDEVLLPFSYDYAEEVGDFLEKTKVLKIREHREDGLTSKEQGRKNFKAMMKCLMKDYPKETSEILSKLWVLEEGEKRPNAFTTLTKVITNKDVLDFFSSLMRLV